MQQAETYSPPAHEKTAALARRSAIGGTITLVCDHPAAFEEEECRRFLLRDLIEAAGDIG